MNLDSDSRIVMTLNAGCTNLRFAAIRGGNPVNETVSLPSNGDDLAQCLANIVEGFTQVKALCAEPPSVISFAYPGPADYPSGIIGDNSMAGEVWMLRNKFHPAMNAEEGACIRAVRRVYAEQSGTPFEQVPEPKELFEIANGAQPGYQAAAKEAFRRLASAVFNLDYPMKTLPLLTLSLSLATLLPSAVKAEASSPPNVVIIFCDDMGYADIGPFGCTDYATPNLDRLAREGRRFTNFHVSEAICSASRASLLTGCYNNRIGIFNALNPTVSHGLNPVETTLAEIFKQKGYATGMAGKWHLGHLPPFLPIHHGFDEYYGLPYSNDMWPHGTEKYNVDLPPLPLIEGDNVIKADVTAEDQEQLTTRYTERAVDFIKRNHNRPFFFYLAHSMPHVPLYVSDKFKGKSGAGLYGDVIQEIDWSVGQVMDALKSEGLDGNTLLIFTSDNGPWLRYGNHAGSAGPLREGKATSWEGGTRVPCVMRWPGRIPAGTSGDDMLMTIDLLPTFASVIGATLPDHTIDGLDVLPLIVGAPGAKNPHQAYWTYFGHNELQSVCTGNGRWKLVFPHNYNTLNGKPGGLDGYPVHYEHGRILEPQLFDLIADIGEKTNVAAAHPEVVEKLEAAAEKARADLGDSLTKRAASNIRPPGRVK